MIARHVASNVLTILVVALFLAAGLLVWGKQTYEARGPLDNAVCVKVPRGAVMRSVAEDLESKGALARRSIFELGAEYGGKSSALKAGSFLIPSGASMAEITDILTRGGQSTCGTEVIYRIGVSRFDVRVRALDPATGTFAEQARFDLSAQAERPAVYTQAKADADTRYRVSFAEGATSWQVTEGLRGIDLLTGEIDAVPAEGSLAPDSYEVTPGLNRSVLLRQMSERQSARLQEVWSERGTTLLKSPEEVMILASIIEKETGVPQERGKVASVFVNRLREGIKLQTDPTVIYGITNGKGALGRGLRQSELRRPTKYNTYVIPGLPPTPIANPGLASLQAAMRPDDTPFIFFVADGTGGHAFAETLAEHNRNVAKWRKIEAERQKN